MSITSNNGNNGYKGIRHGSSSAFNSSGIDYASTTSSVDDNMIKSKTYTFNIVNATTGTIQPGEYLPVNCKLINSYIISNGPVTGNGSIFVKAGSIIGQHSISTLPSGAIGTTVSISTPLLISTNVQLELVIELGAGSPLCNGIVNVTLVFLCPPSTVL